MEQKNQAVKRSTSKRSTPTKPRAMGQLIGDMLSDEAKALALNSVKRKATSNDTVATGTIQDTRISETETSPVGDKPSVEDPAVAPTDGNHAGKLRLMGLAGRNKLIGRIKPLAVLVSVIVVAHVIVAALSKVGANNE